MSKHYSFDMWETLIKGNPEYKTMRMREIHKFVLSHGSVIVGEGDITSAFSNANSFADLMNLSTGESVSNEILYRMVLLELMPKKQFLELKPLDINVLIAKLDQLFLQYPPSMYSEDTIPVLKELHVRGNHLTILSNTSFVKGRVLNQVLEMNGVLELFTKTYYSDEHNMSKPNPDFFGLMHMDSPYETDDIVHIGDNPIADGEGASNYGIKSLIINSNSKTIKDVL